MTVSPDVIVIGAGLAGCSVAWHLRKTHRVCLFEQGSAAGSEASAQNAGMVRRLGEDPYERALSLRSHRFFTQPGPDWPEPPSRKVGAFLGFVDDPFLLHDGVAHLRAHGVRVEAVDRPSELVPVLSGSPVRSGWFLPDEHVADAHALISGFLSGVRRAGGALRHSEPVLQLLTEGDRVVGVQTAQGRLYAAHVILASGAWSAELARTVGLNRPLIPLARTLLFSSNVASDPMHPWTWLDDIGLYVRPESGGWLGSPCDESPAGYPTGPGSLGPVESMARALMMQKIERYIPTLSAARWSRGWTGLRTFAPDRRPVLGADPERPGLWWAAGLGGFGVSSCAAVGETLAAWIRGESTPWMDPSGVCPGRVYPRRLLIRPHGDWSRSRLFRVNQAGETDGR